MELQRDVTAGRNWRRDEIVSGPFSATAIEWLVDAAGCDPELLSDLEQLQHTCNAVVAGLHLRVIGEPHWHHFPSRTASAQPGGATGLYLLAESHLTCHTFPEDGLAAFNLYCCRGREPWDWNTFLRERLGAAEVVVRTITRGGTTPLGPTGERA